LKLLADTKKDKKKSFKKNNKEYKRLIEHIGLIPLVMITPSDSVLITGGSEDRRKFIDSVISQFNREYLDKIIRYNKVLQYRNKLLKHFAQNKYFDNDLFETYNQQLIEYGEYIHKQRKNFISELIPVFQEYYDLISGGKEKVKLIYKSQLNDNNFSDLLNQNFEKDKILTYTSTGVHKDDIELILEDYLIRKKGSQGQQKTYLIALKLAQFKYMANKNKFKPILLFDDIFDKLDSSRVENILRLVSDDNFGQIFLTDANKQRIQRILSELTVEFSVYKIKDGQATK
jgi:DNA replication and repair protein RecF